ncbi:MAG: S41 family peptidase [Salibacteraceae bacterium]
MFFRKFIPPALSLLVFGLLLNTTAHAQFDTYDGAKKFESFLEDVSRYYVDTVNPDQLVESAIMGVLKDLDPHSVYISKEELKRMNEPLVGNFDGIGIQYNMVKDTIVVVSPISGGPSEKLGVRPGDRIVYIGDKLVAGVGFSSKDVTEHLRGPKGTQVHLRVKRRGEVDLVPYTITRDRIPIFSVDASYMINKDIGYIKLNRFSATTMGEIELAVGVLQSKGMKHMILDLRGNSGGYLRTAIDLADQFLSNKKLVVYTEGRSFPKKEKFATSKGNFEKGKLVVMIDEGSASASEIVAGAIQDWDRGIIIGRRSFGKGLVQKPYSMPDGSAIRLTISRYYTPTGRSIQRPYEDGTQEYYKAITQRFETGEVWSSDSIQFPDSLKFYTPKKRVVYGGGGIMPDIFVPLDTSGISDYYNLVRRKGLLNDFVISYLDDNRDQLLSSYNQVTDFKDEFEVNAALLARFYDYAAAEGVAQNDDDILISGDLIALQIKALIARGLWKTGAYYQIYNDSDATFNKAVEIIEGRTFEKMKLSYK